MALAGVWQMFAVVPGFALYDGAAGSVSAYTHYGWWSIIDGATIVWGIASLYFGINYVPSQRLVERGISRNITWLLVYIIVLGVNGISHLTHFVLSLFERVHCDSTLCINNGGVLIAFICGLGIEMFLNFYAIKDVVKYKSNLTNVVANFEYVLMVKGPPLPPAASDNNPNAANSSIKQRLLTMKQMRMMAVAGPIQHKMK